MDVLSQLFEAKFTDGSIGYHPKANDLKISGLAFADDLMIFYDGKPFSLLAITSILVDFKLLFGLEMTSNPTSIFT